MLKEDKRQKLDTIVMSMVNNGYSKESIQNVVEDFKSRHDQPETQEKQNTSFGSKVLGGVQKFGDVAEKYFLKPVSNFMGTKQVGEMLEPVVEAGAVAGSYAFGDKGKDFRQDVLANPRSKITQEFDAAKDLDKQAWSLAQQVGGRALEGGAKLATFAAGGLGTTGLTGITKGAGFAPNAISFTNSLVGRSAELAFTRAVGEGLQEKDSAGTILKDASIQGLIAGATSYVIGKISEKLVAGLEKKYTNLGGRALKPKINDVQADIERGVDTINTSLVKEGYVGKPEKIFDMAVNNKEKFGNEIGNILSKADKKGKIILKADVLKGFDKLLERNYVLDEGQVNLILKEVDKLPAKMNASTANAFKQQFAEDVSRSGWNSLASEADSFRNMLFKTLSGGLRDAVEDVAPAVAIANEKWAIANDVMHLASRAIAKLQSTGGATGVGYKTLGGFALEKTLGWTFTPKALTLRAQLLRELEKAGQTELAQELGKFLLIKGQEAVLGKK